MLGEEGLLPRRRRIRAQEAVGTKVCIYRSQQQWMIEREIPYDMLLAALSGGWGGEEEEEVGGEGGSEVRDSNLFYYKETSISVTGLLMPSIAYNSSSNNALCCGAKWVNNPDRSPIRDCACACAGKLNQRLNSRFVLNQTEKYITWMVSRKVDDIEMLPRDETSRQHVRLQLSS